jgi:hypothetical protein
MATKSAKATKGLRHGRTGLMSHAGLRPRPGSRVEWDPGSGGVASLNHRLQAGIPPGCLGDVRQRGPILNFCILNLAGHWTPLGGEGVRLEGGRIRPCCGLCVHCG